MASDQAEQNERQQTGNVLRTFVREDGRLVRLPARWSRKLIVLRQLPFLR